MIRRFVVLTTVALLATAPAAAAVDQGKGHPGYCTTEVGVTVVVDFQQLGGTTIVRCDPQGTRGTGLDALKGAGFQIAGVQRWGEAFICRVENRPSAVETVPVKGRSDYQESCVDTPPAAAYWSYWHAGNNCPWTYSQWGVKNRDFIPGGFEGWSFSLNATADSNPVPRIATARPGTADKPCVTPEEAAPNSSDPKEKQPQAGGIQPAPATTTRPQAAPPPSDAGALPPPKPRAAATATAPFTGGENAADITVAVKAQSGASDYAPWVAGAAVLLLAAVTWLTARRRKRARES